MKKTFFLLAVAAAILVSCQKETLVSNQNQNLKPAYSISGNYDPTTIAGVFDGIDKLFYEEHVANVDYERLTYLFGKPVVQDPDSAHRYYRCMPPFQKLCIVAYRADKYSWPADDLMENYGYDTLNRNRDLFIVCHDAFPVVTQGKVQSVLTNGSEITNIEFKTLGNLQFTFTSEALPE